MQLTRPTRLEGYDALRLRSASAYVDATFVPRAGMVGASLRDRGEELHLPRVPRLVVQGGRDAFGVPAPSAGVSVHVVAGADHGFAVRRRDGRTAGDVRDELERVVRAWLAERLAGPGQTLT